MKGQALKHQMQTQSGIFAELSATALLSVKSFLVFALLQALTPVMQAARNSKLLERVSCL